MPTDISLTEYLSIYIKEKGDGIISDQTKSSPILPHENWDFGITDFGVRESSYFSD